MDRFITFERATETPDAAGQPIPEPWTAFYQCWAEKRPARGEEQFRGQQLIAKRHTIFRIYFPEDGVTITPDESIRLVDDDGRAFDITHVDEIGYREGLEILATARAE